MFSNLDTIIFPDNCEVIEIVPSEMYVYPIFKNGSSSLRLTQSLAGWRTIYNQDIQQIETPITVFLRDPQERFINGVNTFIQFCLRDHPDLDFQTILYFVEHYFFLNRHYSPQFYWLINLARYSKAPLLFKPMDDVNMLTNNLNVKTGRKLPNLEFAEIIKNFPFDQLNVYFFLDRILIDYIGKQTTFNQIISDIKIKSPELYKLVFKKTQDIINVLS